MQYIQNKGVSIISTCLWILWILLVVETVFGSELEWSSEENEVSSEEVDNQIDKGKEREATTLRCHRRLYKAKVEQKDTEGRRCWDILSLDACWGRCDSHEISEWKFPYKRSKHPVCGFGERIETVVKLKNCEDGAGPEAQMYRHVRPLNCVCRACSSADTSCGWLPLH